MTALPVRFTIRLSAVLLLAACGIDSETSASLVSAGGASGNASSGRGGSFVEEAGGSQGLAGKGASAGSAGALQGQAGSGATGGKGGGTNTGGAGGAVSAGTGGNGSSSNGGSASNGGAQAGGTGGTGAGKAGTGGASSTSGGTGGATGSQGGSMANGGTGPTTAGSGGTGGGSTNGGTGGQLGTGGSTTGFGGSTVGLGGGTVGFGGRAGGPTGGPQCGDGKIEKGETCERVWSPTNPNPNSYECNSECQLCPGVLIAGVCYFSPKGKVPWDAAEALCAAESARLATPGLGQFAELTSLPEKEDILWAAVRQAEDAASPTEGWTWRAGPENGSEVDPLIWSDDEPNDLLHDDESIPGEDCGAVIRSRAMKYDDKECGTEYRVLCERKWD